ncbi:ATP-binding cassette, subfamily B [Amycolatopsis xylanica]|uniref:ATP-binding cassette, subfamily B n=1 Tax=Amycolatopsis xylanica TaxID=589385 RepID=A0A1H3SEJ2_9PSEU|nr:ABC transporter ATP-binding protein [Amycolatopsis xylanica]SDZ36324.1 ATP-binding cassette, subfamily B [Amycolatopsis xylanica]
MRESDRLLIGTAKRGKRLLSVLALCRLFETAAGILLPVMLASVIDTVISRDGMMTPAVLLIILLGLITLAEIGEQIAGAKVNATAAARLRHSVFARVFELGLPGGRRFPVGDVLNRAMDSAAEVSRAGPNLLDMICAPLISLGGLVALALIDWRLVLVFAVGVPVVSMLASRLIRRVTVLTGRYQEAQGELASRFVEAVGGARTIRAAGTLDREVTRVLTPLSRLHEAGLEFWETQRRAGWYLSLLAPTLQVGVLVIAGIGVVDGRVSAGELLAAQLYLGYALRLLSQVGILAELGRIRGSAERVQEIFDEPLPPGGDRPLPPGPGVLELRGITAIVDGRTVLDDVHLTIPAGSEVAIVGASGTGKTTLALIAGAVLPPQSGKILLDGTDLATVSRDETRRAISVAFERPCMLGDTVGEMIGFGDDYVADTAVELAARASHAAGFIARLPSGYGTPLAGLRLSGGESQRLGLARSVCRGARVVVLDDALSSVDTATESEITAAMHEALRGVTRIVVAHRMRTAAGADLVAWLDEGRVRAFGAHHELLADPAYQALFGAQPVGVS